MRRWSKTSTSPSGGLRGPARGAVSGLQLLVYFAEGPFDRLDGAVGAAFQAFALPLLLGGIFLPKHLPARPPNVTAVATATMASIPEGFRGSAASGEGGDLGTTSAL